MERYTDQGSYSPYFGVKHNHNFVSCLDRSNPNYGIIKGCRVKHEHNHCNQRVGLNPCPSREMKRGNHTWIG